VTQALAIPLEFDVTCFIIKPFAVVILSGIPEIPIEPIEILADIRSRFTVIFFVVVEFATTLIFPILW
jgi:hypothetical protein